MMSLADFLVISSEAVSAFVNAFFDDGSDEDQDGAGHAPEKQHAGATTVDGYHAPIWRRIWRNFDDLQPKKIYKVLKAAFQPAPKEYKAKHGRNIQLDTSTSVDPETHGGSKIADVTHPCKDGVRGLHKSVSVHGKSGEITKFIGCLITPETNKEGRALPPRIDCGSRGQTDRTKPNRVDQETRRTQTRVLTARDVRLKRFDERVDRINPMSMVELDPWGALMARQTGSGRMEAHGIIRGGSQAKYSSEASSSATTQRCI
jgi:hypothetical protein